MMKFQLGASTITLWGDSSLSKSLITLKAMNQTLKLKGYGILVEFNNYESKTFEKGSIPVYLREILLQYGLVFDVSTGLPPSRGREIILKEGTTPISVCPYRYPYVHKTE